MKNDKLIYKTLRTIIKEYGVIYKSENSYVYSNTLKLGGTIYRDGYGIRDIEIFEKMLEQPYKISNTDIGYFDLDNANSEVEALKRYGYDVEII